VSLACLGSGVLQLGDSPLFSSLDLFNNVEFLTLLDSVGTVIDSGNFGEGLYELQGSLLLWESIKSAGDCESPLTLDAEELRGAYQVDGVADLTTCDGGKAAGVSGR